MPQDQITCFNANEVQYKNTCLYLNIDNQINGERHRVSTAVIDFVVDIFFFFKVYILVDSYLKNYLGLKKIHLPDLSR